MHLHSIAVSGPTALVNRPFRVSPCRSSSSSFRPRSPPSRDRPAASRARHRALGALRQGGHDHPRRLGHRAHSGKTDADAVFGMIYAQAEDDFNRVETNFINSQGRLAEAEGEAEIWRDLRMKLFIDPDSMKAQYATSPAWLRS